MRQERDRDPSESSASAGVSGPAAVGLGNDHVERVVAHETHSINMPVLHGDSVGKLEATGCSHRNVPGRAPSVRIGTLGINPGAGPMPIGDGSDHRLSGLSERERRERLGMPRGKSMASIPELPWQRGKRST